MVQVQVNGKVSLSVARLEQLQWAVVRITPMEFLRCNNSSATVTNNFPTNN